MLTAVYHAQEILNNMSRNPIRLAAPTALVVLALTMTLSPAMAAPAATPKATDVTAAFREAGVTLDRLQVVEIGGIVVIRGRAEAKAQAEEAGLVALRLGYPRVANLVQIIEKPDDAAIKRKAEVALTVNRSMDGCRLSVDSRQGILHVNGQIKHELQRDVAVQLLRNIQGVREVRLELVRF